MYYIRLLLLVTPFFTVVFSESSYYRQAFDKAIGQTEDIYRHLIFYQIESNKSNTSTPSNYLDQVIRYGVDAEGYWSDIRVYIPHVYLKIQASNDVCEIGISHSIDKLLNQFMTAASQYMFSQHVVYNIREKVDKQSFDDHRQEFNTELRSEIEESLRDIADKMKNSSSNYWLCDPDQPINPSNFIPEIQKEYKQGSSDCEEIQKSGYQCIPSNNNRKCDCIKSSMVINLAMAKADPGYVLIGIQMKIDGQTLSIVAKQAKLLPNGKIDKNTIKLVPQRKAEKTTYANFVLRKSTLLLGETVIPQDRFLTGVGFHKSYEDFYIRTESTKFDIKRKELILSDTRIEQFRRTNGTKFARAIDIKKSPSGQISDVQWTNRIYPLIDDRMVEPSSPTPLAGISLFIRGKSENEGFLAIKINTYKAISTVPKVKSLDGFPTMEILNNLTSIKSLEEMETKFVDYVL